MTQPLNLSLPDFYETFVVECDASGINSSIDFLNHSTLALLKNIARKRPLLHSANLIPSPTQNSDQISKDFAST
jgi:hypothetical protein